MIASGVIATWINFSHGDWLYSQKLLTTVTLTALVWIPVTLFTAPAARERLEAFVELIRPGGRGWQGFAALASGGPGQALRNWVLALIVLFSINFGLGWLLLRL